jgi:GntR family transcriptional regulator/MocR family aminotransferase
MIRLSILLWWLPLKIPARQRNMVTSSSILQGTMRSGERLPSTRELAEQLHVSRTVAVLAYERLLAEGFVAGYAGSGTYVSEGLATAHGSTQAKLAKVKLSSFGLSVEAATSKVNYPSKRTTSLHYDFAYGRSDVEIFPFEMWRRMLLRHSRKAPVRELDYGPTAGTLPSARRLPFISGELARWPAMRHK